MSVPYLHFWYVLLSVVVWTALYYIVLSSNPKRSELWNCRILAMMHSLMVTKLIEISLLVEGNPFCNIGERNSDLQNLAMVFSGGYFLFDLAWCILKGNEGFMILLHHVVSVLSLTGGLYLDHSGAEICTTLWGSELTNPFLQIRWFLREVKMYDSSFGAFNDLTFFSIFALSRIGIGTGLAVLFYYAKKTIMTIKVAGFLFYGISVVWMLQICKYVKYKYCK